MHNGEVCSPYHASVNYSYTNNIRTRPVSWNEPTTVPTGHGQKLDWVRGADAMLATGVRRRNHAAWSRAVIRLYVDAALTAGAAIEATEGQAHYLGSVMRRAVGDAVHLFNGTDGEWSCLIASLSRGKAAFAVETLIRPQSDDADLWLMFAVLKRDATDLIVQKSTELGVSALLPVFTERTNAGRVNLDRLRAIAIEAAEQSERLTIPVVRPAKQLHSGLAEWPAGRPLFVALERADAQPLIPAVEPAGLLIGPEGGFGPRDHTMLGRCRFVRPVSLGPRILRAETAAIVGLALLQAPLLQAPFLQAPLLQARGCG